MAPGGEAAQQRLSEARRAIEADRVEEAATAASDAMKLFREAGDLAGVARALAIILPAQISQGQVTLEGAQRMLREEAAQLGRTDERRGDAAVQFAIAQACLAAGNADKALSAALDAQALFARERDMRLEAEVLSKVITPAYLQNGDEDKALAAATQALSLVQRDSDALSKVWAWQAVATARNANGVLQDAVEAASEALSAAISLGDKCKESEIRCLISQLHLGGGEVQLAAATAQGALDAARETGSGPRIAAAVNVLVEAHVQAREFQTALQLAQDELAAFQNAGNTLGLASMMGAVVVATTAQKGANAGLETVKRFVETCRAEGDKRGEVEMMHRLACMAEYPEQALNSAQAALLLAQKNNLACDEVKIKETLSKLWVAKGRFDKAPNRRYAMALLNELARCLESKDAEKFKETNKKLNKYWGVLAEADMETTLHRVISRDPEACMAFLREHGVVAEEDTPKQEAPVVGHKFKAVPHQSFYYTFKVSGLAYGPRFRCVASANKAVHNKDGEALAVVELQDESDTWERELLFSPSLLDGVLQSSLAIGL